MLPRSLRLTKTTDITTTLRSGHRLITPHVRVHARPKPQAKQSRVAIIVSKKVAASAVRRHHYQRWLRAIAADLLPRLANKFDLVLVALPSIKNVPDQAALRHTLQSITAKLESLPTTKPTAQRGKLEHSS